MRRQSGRRDRHWFHQRRAVPGIRRYLLCLRNDASDTDSDSIPLSSLLDDANNDTDAVNYSAALLTQMNDVSNVDPAVCTGLMQVYSTSDTTADARQVLVHGMSAVRSAMPLFADHLQLPLFTGQRRWHTMFGQLNQLTSSSCADTTVLNVDEDILADSNFASLFDRESHPHHNSNASCMTAQSFHTVQAANELPLIENDFPALDETVDSIQSAAEQFVLSSNRSNSDSHLVSVTNLEPSCDPAISPLAQNGCTSHEYVGRWVGSVTASGGSQVRTLHARRHSDPGSIHSGTTGSLSANSNTDNWYYYDRRLRPGGALAAQYGRLRTRRSLSMIVSPPAYDDVCYTPVSNTLDQYPTDALSEHLLSVSEPTCENFTELPPPYQQSELPPSYSEVTNIVELNEQWDSVMCPALTTHSDYSQLSCAENWQAGDGVMRTRCSNSHALFSGRPAVRWNRNTSVERWTSSFNWVMS